MFCQKCGAKNPDDANSCTSCGQPFQAPVVQAQAYQPTPQNPFFGQQMPQQPYIQQGAPQQRHDVPRCTCCGYVGPWKVDSLFRPIDYVIGIILLICFIIPGITYLGTVALIRANKDRRAKICPSCKARNLWTFFY